MSRYQDEMQKFVSINKVTLFDLFPTQKGGFMELIQPEKEVGFVHVGSFIVDVMIRVFKEEEAFTYNNLFDNILRISYAICDMKHYGSSAIDRSFSYLVRSHLSYNYSDIPLPNKLNPTLLTFSRELWNVLTIKDLNEYEIVSKMIETKSTRIPQSKVERQFFWKFNYGEEM